jgi:NADP-dependent 3-hydroxy acid dehydrogenase YdfG
MIISGATAVVTGASSGVGRRVSERLAALGANVGLLGRDTARLEQTAASCRPSGTKIIACSGEISDAGYVEGAFATIEAALGPVDILVNCAGISLPARLAVEDISHALWDEIMQTNVRGTYLTCHRAVGGMKQRRRGAIVNIGSTGAHVALPGVSAYAASKFAVRALTDALIGECDSFNVRVSMVSAGPINTPIWDKRPGSPTPISREAMLQPDDIADAVLWLIERPSNVRADEILLRPAGRTPPLESAASTGAKPNV